MVIEAFAGVGVVTYVGRQIYRSRRPKPRLVDLLQASRSRMSAAVPKKLSKPTELPSEAIQKGPSSRRKPGNIVLSSLPLGLALGGLVFPTLRLLAIPGILYYARPVFRRAFNLLKTERRVGAPSVTTITILGSIAFGHIIISSFATFMYSFSGNLLDKVTRDTRGDMIDIFKLTPSEVWLLVDGVEVAVHIDEVKPGDLIVVHAGSIIPVDGVIREGIATIDQHVLTGEGTPVEKEQGQEVFASTVVHGGRIVVEVQHAGEETTLAKIGQILNESVEFKSTVTLRAIELADRLAFPAIMFGALTAPVLGTESGLAVTNSHFKNKMGLLTPITIMNFFKIAMQNGIIIKDGRSFELLNQVDTIVFDKTGTLTEEQPTVGDIHLCAQYDELEVLRFAATAEYKQTHPIAKAILKRAASEQLELPEVDDVDYKVGYGLSVTVAEELIQVGSIRFMQISNIEIPDNIIDLQDACFDKGHSLLMIAVNQTLIGAIELIPTIRPEAKAVIQNLMQRPQITASYIISGDNEIPTRILAQELGIDHYFAETLPQEKAKLIGELREEGRFICYIGDGINDSIALKQAHVSISLSGASMIAIDTAQIVLMEQGLSHLGFLFDLAKQFEKNMNLMFTVLIIPAFFGISSILFLGTGLAASMVFNTTGLACGLLSAMLPAIKNKFESKQIESTSC